MTPPLVSVALPAGAGGPPLARTIESVLDQAYPHLELLLVDHGPGGGVAAAAARYGDRLRYLRAGECNVGAALGRATAAMHGDLFGWLLPGERYLPDKLERQVAALASFGGEAVAVGDWTMLDAAGTSPRGIDRLGVLARPLDLIFRHQVPGAALLVPRTLLDGVGGFDATVPATGGWDLLHRLAGNARFIHAPGAATEASAPDPVPAGWLLAHLLRHTPAGMMRAYDGTPLAFLEKLAHPLDGMSIARAWLDARIAELRKAPPPPLLTPPPPRWPGPTSASGIPTILFLTHRLGGGTDTHLRRLAAALAPHARLLFGYGGTESAEAGAGLAIRDRPVMESPGPDFPLPAGMDQAVAYIRAVGVDRVDVLHALGFEAECEALLAALALPHDATLVDYHPFATAFHLCDAAGRFIGDDALGDHLRPEPLAYIRQAARVIAISEDLAARAGRIAAGLPIVCARPDPAPPGAAREVRVPRIAPAAPLRILVAGLHGPSKGSTLLGHVAAIAARRRLPLRFHSVGALDASVAHGADSCITDHGPFPEGRFHEAVAMVDPDLAWLPCQAPETWCYVLSDLMDALLPIAATAIGALPERCAGRAATWLLPWRTTPTAWVDFFLRLHATGLALPPVTPSPAASSPAGPPFYPDAYLAPVRAQIAGR